MVDTRILVMISAMLGVKPPAVKLPDSKACCAPCRDVQCLPLGEELVRDTGNKIRFCCAGEPICLDWEASWERITRDPPLH